MITISDAEFLEVCKFVKSNFGLSFNSEKKTLVQSRLKIPMMESKFTNFADYFEFIKSDITGRELTNFVNRITTNHTFFMREPEHFQYFKEVVLPYIQREYAFKRELNLWSCACSSGEEAVVLQIIAQEFFKANKEKWNTQILATDISTKVLDKAVAGYYPTESLINLPKSWKTQYFTKKDEINSQLTQDIHKEIIYRKFNMMDPFRFGKGFQVIFCRNVMIYFDAPTREKVIKKFFEATEPGGYLFIGHSESISNTASGYQYIKPAVYRKPL